MTLFFWLSLGLTIASGCLLWVQRGLKRELADAKARAAEKISKDPPRVYFKGNLTSTRMSNKQGFVELSFRFHQEGQDEDYAYSFMVVTDRFTANRFEVGAPVNCFIELTRS